MISNMYYLKPQSFLYFLKNTKFVLKFYNFNFKNQGVVPLIPNNLREFKFLTNETRMISSRGTGE